MKGNRGMKRQRVYSKAAAKFVQLLADEVPFGRIEAIMENTRMHQVEDDELSEREKEIAERMYPNEDEIAERGDRLLRERLSESERKRVYWETRARMIYRLVEDYESFVKKLEQARDMASEETEPALDGNQT